MPDSGREVIDYNHQSRSHDHRPRDRWDSGQTDSPTSSAADGRMSEDRGSHGMVGRGRNRWNSEDFPHQADCYTGGPPRDNWESKAREKWDNGRPRDNWQGGPHGENWDGGPHHPPICHGRGPPGMWDPPPHFPIPPGPGIPPWDRPPPGPGFPPWEGLGPGPEIMSWEGPRPGAPPWGEGHGNHPPQHGIPRWEGHGPPPQGLGPPSWDRPGPGIPPWGEGPGPHPPRSGAPPWDGHPRSRPPGPGAWDGPPPGFPLPPSGPDHGASQPPPPAPPPAPSIPYFDLPAGIMVSLVRVSLVSVLYTLGWVRSSSLESKGIWSVRLLSRMPIYVDRR